VTIKKIKQVKKYSSPLRKLQGTLARTSIEKAHAFAEHLVKVFYPYPSENEPEEEEALTHLLETPYQLEPPINRLKRSDVQEVVNSLKTKKLPGYDLITGKILTLE
jgi:Ser/Thr protein kinase RdoA (MazF antagonist)